MRAVVSAVLFAVVVAWPGGAPLADGAGGVRGDAAEPWSARCCKICRKGKACGDSCISRNKTCRKGPGCACDAGAAIAPETLGERIERLLERRSGS